MLEQLASVPRISALLKALRLKPAAKDTYRRGTDNQTKSQTKDTALRPRTFEGISQPVPAICCCQAPREVEVGTEKATSTAAASPAATSTVDKDHCVGKSAAVCLERSQAGVLLARQLSCIRNL